MSVQDKFRIGDKVILADQEYAKGFFPDYKGEELTVVDIEKAADEYDNDLLLTDADIGAYAFRFRLVEDAPKAQDNSWYDGGGLPPVGANIEYKLGAGPWFEATVKYVLDVLDGDEDEIVIACPHLGFEQLLTLNKHTKIRPTVTPEQIAKQEREKVIQKMVSCAEERMSFRSICEALYDAGLRFVGEDK